MSNEPCDSGSSSGGVAPAIEALVDQLIFWSTLFHDFYRGTEQEREDPKGRHEALTVFEVSAFYLFVLWVYVSASKQCPAVQEELYDFCFARLAQMHESIGTFEQVRDLLLDRGDRYSEYAKAQTDRSIGTIAHFFSGWWSPLDNQLGLARCGTLTPANEQPPFLIGGFQDLPRRCSVGVALYTSFVVPFIATLRAVLDDNEDFRALPAAEVVRRASRATERIIRKSR